MDDKFHLLDLRSQAIAVQSVLRGQSPEQKIEWLSSRGSITPLQSRQPAKPVFRFESRSGAECLFFIDGDEFVFIGDHTTYKMTDHS